MRASIGLTHFQYVCFFFNQVGEQANGPVAKFLHRHVGRTGNGEKVLQIYPVINKIATKYLGFVHPGPLTSPNIPTMTNCINRNFVAIYNTHNNPFLVRFIQTRLDNVLLIKASLVRSIDFYAPT